MRIAVLGVGLIGGSIGLAAKEHVEGAEVVGFGRDPERLRTAAELGAIDRAAESLGDAVMLCERGIRTYEPSYRFTLDLMAVPVLRELTHLPIVVDPSHAAGKRSLVEPLSLAAAAAGADGIIVEIHPSPEEAVCDGPQALYADDFAAYLRKLEAAAELAGKQFTTVQ